VAMKILQKIAVVIQIVDTAIYSRRE